MLELTKNSKGKILKLFFEDVDREYYLREIAKILGKEPGYYQKIINDLVLEGILKDERKGNLRFFKLNKNYTLYDEIKKIVSKTLGVESKIKEVINEFNDIKYAFIFGSLAKNRENGQSDVDLLLIGKANQDDLTGKLSSVEEELNREVNYHLFTHF